MRFRVMARVVTTEGGEQSVKGDTFEHDDEEEARKHYLEVVKRMRRSHAYGLQQASLERQREDGRWERIDQLTKEQIR